MSFDLDKAEMIIEEQCDKIKEQEQLIVNLGEQYKEEVKAKELLLNQINE